jgi:hypothetical protein
MPEGDAMSNTPAHKQTQTIRLLRAYPSHEPRAQDPNYAEFEQVRARLKAQGLLKCIVNNADCSGGPQLHHTHVEFAYQNAVDVPTLDKLLGLSLTDADFAQWVESPGNLEVLCEAHHVGILGIHMIPTADWDIVRVHLPGFNPVQVESGGMP